MILNTSDTDTIKPYIDKLHKPDPISHKGQNGNLLIIGGSSLFHAASLWSAAIASRVVDMVHYCSTQENQKILINLKSKFVDGIVIKKEDLLDYVNEDDCVVIGPGMLRGPVSDKNKRKTPTLKELLRIEDEAEYTYQLTKFLIEHAPNMKFVFDGGALQMMKKDWLIKLKTKPILTPHSVEFKRLFGIDIKDKPTEERGEIVKRVALEHKSIILLKAVQDIMSDGQEVITVHGGNAGLTKGGTGDVLAGLVGALNAKNDQLTSCVVSSIFLKRAADELSSQYGLWYNTSQLIDQIPRTAKALLV